METKHQIIDPAQEDEPKFRCGLCVFTTKQKGYLNSHWEKTHNNIKLDLRCQACDFEAKDLSSIEEHITESHPESDKLHTCDQCEFRTFHVPAMKAHVKSVHEGRKCEFCDFVGTTRGTLKHHITAKHVRVRNFVCELCGFSCVSEHMLEKHRKRHLGSPLDQMRLSYELQYKLMK